MNNDLVLMIKRKEFGKAKRFLQRELSQHSDNVYLLTQMANVLWNLGKDDSALSHADKAEAVDENYPLLLFTKGRILWSLERYKESVKMWDKLLCLELSDVAEKGWGNRWAKSVVNDARFYKADCLYCLNDTKEAKVLMEAHLANRRKGQESDFTVMEAKVFLRRLTYSTGKVSAEGNETSGWASEKQWSNMQKEFAKRRNDKSALVAYMKKKSRAFPNEYYLKTLLAENLIDLGKYRDALKYGKEAYTQEPSDMLVVYDYGNALYCNGYYDKAIQVLDIILQTDINVIAFGDYGEGLRWAKKLLNDAELIMELAKKKFDGSPQISGDGSLQDKAAEPSTL